MVNLKTCPPNEQEPASTYCPKFESSRQQKERQDKTYLEESGQRKIKDLTKHQKSLKVGTGQDGMKKVCWCAMLQMGCDG